MGATESNYKINAKATKQYLGPSNKTKANHQKVKESRHFENSAT